jgi:putative ATP-dependent endonuclease of the OLD family
MNAANPLVQLYTDQRMRVVEALMYPAVLVPEGRIDFEWLRLLLDVSEMGTRSPVATAATTIASPPFGSIVGVIPTRDSALKMTFESLRPLHTAVFALVDGDAAGDGYIRDLLASNPPPSSIVQWPAGWEIEDVLAWSLAGGPATLLNDINSRLGQSFRSMGDLIAVLRNDDGRTGGLKAHYIAHEEIAAVMKQHSECVARAELVLEALSRAALLDHAGFRALAVDPRSTGDTVVLRFHP